MIDVMIEVDFTGERTGVAADDAPALADAMGPIEGLRLVGLMTSTARFGTTGQEGGSSVGASRRGHRSYRTNATSGRRAR